MIKNVTKMVQLVLFGSWVLITPSFYSPPTAINRIALWLILLCRIEKNDLICKAEADTDVETKHVDTKGERKEWKELGDWD